MRKMKSLLVAFLIAATSINCVGAKESTQGFNEMLDDLMSGNSSCIKVESNGLDITDIFIENFDDVYKLGDVETIVEYAADNAVMFVLPNNNKERAIKTGTYTTNHAYVVFNGTSVLTGQSIRLPVLMSIRVTCNYDFNTAKITGGVRTPTIILEDTEGVADQVRATNVTHNGSIVNGGYSVQYTQISFVPEGLGTLDDMGLWQTYNSYTWKGTIYFTPGGGV